MAVIPLTYYRATCDTCGIGYEDSSGEGIVAWEFPHDAVLAAADIGWLHTVDDTLTCPSCLRCELCGEHPAWVGGPELDNHRRVLCDECEIPATRTPPARRLPGLDRHLTIVSQTGDPT